MGSEPIDPNDIEALQRQLAELQAKLTAAQQANVSGSGAAVQGGGDALGERSVKVHGDNQNRYDEHLGKVHRYPKRCTYQGGL